MIFVMLAIGRRSPGRSANSTWPVSRSTRIADGAAIMGGFAVGRGVESDVGKGDGEPNGGTGVGGGVEVGAGPAIPIVRTSAQRKTGTSRRAVGRP